MFRTWRAGMGILGTSRLPLTVKARILRDGGTSQVQRVRFKRVIRPRNLLGTTIGLLILYNLFDSIVLAPLEKITEELVQGLDEKTKNELMAESDAGLFIRLPFTVKKFQGPRLRHTDPEIRECFRICSDPKLKEKIKDDLVDITKGIVENILNIPPRSRRARKSRSALDLRIPNYQPPIYLQSVIVIGGDDGFVSYGKIPLESITAKRIARATYPVPVLCAMWAWVKVMLTPGDPRDATFRIVQSVFPQLSAIEKAEKDQRAHTEGPPPRVGPNIRPSGPVDSHPASAQHNGLKQIEAAASKQADAASKEESPASSDAAAKLREGQGQVPKSQTNKEVRGQTLIEMMNGSNPFRSRYGYAAAAFQFELERRWKKIIKDPPRGALHVFGVIEIVVDRERILLDVSAYWDPMTKQYDPESGIIAFKHIPGGLQGLPVIRR